MHRLFMTPALYLWGLLARWYAQADNSAPAYFL